MAGAQYVVDRWWTLSRDELTDEVRHTVRSGGTEAQKIWDAVLTDKKLAARVRGILSSLRTQMKSHRDAAMWEIWIVNARKALTPPEKTEQTATPAETADPAQDGTDTEPDLLTRLAATTTTGSPTPTVDPFSTVGAEGTTPPATSPEAATTAPGDTTPGTDTPGSAAPGTTTPTAAPGTAEGTGSPTPSTTPFHAATPPKDDPGEARKPVRPVPVVHFSSAE